MVCVTCRHGWLTGKYLPMLAAIDQRHSLLHRCAACGAYWEQFERLADVVSEDDARAIHETATIGTQVQK